jgi:predicted permease
MGVEDAIGKTVQLYGMQFSIIGIMPETFDFPTGADIWTYRGEAFVFERHSRLYLGRLRTEISPGKAAEELRTLEFKHGEGLFGNTGPVVKSLRTVLYGDRRPMLWMLGSSAVLFLLLVCAGVMNLLVTQGARRKSEMTIRLIHGATRRNLILQLLRETLPLVVVGALAGAWLSEVVSAWLMSQFPALQGGEVVLPVKIAFSAALVLAVTVIGGLTPALYATDVDLNTYLKSDSNSRRRFGPFSFSLRELLVGIQLSLSLALLTGVGLLVNSLMFHVDVPFRWSSRDMVVVQVEYTRPMESKMVTVEEATRRAMFFREFQNSLHTMPEVANIGIFTPIPFSPEAGRRIQRRGRVYITPPQKDRRRVGNDFYVEALFYIYTSPEGFDLLGIPLIAGRPFSQMDIDDALALALESLTPMMAGNGVGKVIINQSLARQLWPGESAGNAVGKIIYDGFSSSHEIIGVVQDFLLVSNNKNFIPTVYRPEFYAAYLVQTYLVKLHSGLLIKDFRQRLSSLDVGFTTIESSPLGDVVSESMADTRMTLQLLGCFALIGIVVAGLSAYTTTSLMVATMNRETGIRMAMGATTWDILLFVFWRGIRAIFIALPFGLFLAWILSKILSGYLFQVKIDDPLAWIISCALLIGIAVIAALIPALRATRVNPMDAMRNG